MDLKHVLQLVEYAYGERDHYPVLAACWPGHHTAMGWIGHVHVATWVLGVPTWNLRLAARTILSRMVGRIRICRVGGMVAHIIIYITVTIHVIAVKGWITVHIHKWAVSVWCSRRTAGRTSTRREKLGSSAGKPGKYATGNKQPTKYVHVV